MKQALVCGAGGFIGSNLVKYLKAKGYHVKGVDMKHPALSESQADQFITGDLRDASFVKEIIDRPFDEVYQMATDMGGAGYVFGSEHDAEIMYNSTSINLNVLKKSVEIGVNKIFYPSSACVYPELEHGQFKEEHAYPAQPTNEYGWEKLYGERLYASFGRKYDIVTKIARFHTIFGPGETYRGGKEKAAAALARKVIEAQDNSDIEMWGDGKQTRSFLFIDECLEGINRLMQSDDFHGPVNIGSEEQISINRLADIFIELSGKNLGIIHIDGPQGPRNRNSDNSMIYEKLGWKPTSPTKDGLKELYKWIEKQISLS